MKAGPLLVKKEEKGTIKMIYAQVISIWCDKEMKLTLVLK